MQSIACGGVLAATVALITGCYTTATVPTVQIASLLQPLSGPRELPGGARLGPRSEIRVRRKDGSVSSWFPAADLAVSQDGLVTGKSHSLASVTEAAITDADPGAEALLGAVAPPGSEVTVNDNGVRVRVQDPGLLLPWISAYATGAAGLGRQPGTFSFRTSENGENRWKAKHVPGATFVARVPATLSHVELAEGIPWRDVAGLEVQNLDPLTSTAAIVGVPIAGAVIVALMVTAVAMTGDNEDPSAAIALAAGVGEITSSAADTGQRDEQAGVNGETVGFGHAPPPAVLVTAADAGAPARPTPLFSSSARRRDLVKLIAAAEAGVDADGVPTGSVGAGLRICDFVEITGRLRPVAFDDTGTSQLGQPGAGTSRPIHLLGGVRLALHIDGDGDRRTAFVLGGEVLGGSLSGGGSLIQAGFVFGPRFGITDKLFASLLFSPSLVSASGLADRPDTTVGQMMFNAEIGFDL